MSRQSLLNGGTGCFLEMRGRRWDQFAPPTFFRLIVCTKHVPSILKGWWHSRCPPQAANPQWSADFDEKNFHPPEEERVFSRCRFTRNAWRFGKEHRSFHIMSQGCKTEVSQFRNPLIYWFLDSWLNSPSISMTFGRIHPTKKCWIEASVLSFGKLLRFLATTTVTHRSCGFTQSLGGDGCSQDQPTQATFWRNLRIKEVPRFNFLGTNISHLLEGKSFFPATFQGDRISYLSCI